MQFSSNNSLYRSLIALPILYAITVGLNALSILHHLPLLGWYEMPVMFPYIGAAILSVVTATLIQCAVVPLIEERIFNEEKFKQLSIEKARRRDSLRRISMSLSEKKALQANMQPPEIVACDTESDKERKKKIRKDFNNSKKLVHCPNRGHLHSNDYNFSSANTTIT